MKTNLHLFRQSSKGGSAILALVLSLVGIATGSGPIQSGSPEREREDMLRSVFKEARNAADRHRQLIKPEDVNGAMDEATRIAGRMVQQYYRNRGQAIDISTLRFAVRSAADSEAGKGGGNHLDDAIQLGFTEAARGESAYVLEKAIAAGVSPDNHPLVASKAASKVIHEAQTNALNPDRGPIQAGQLFAQIATERGLRAEEVLALAKQAAQELGLSKTARGLMVGGASSALGADAAKAANAARKATEEAGGSPEEIAKAASPNLFPDRSLLFAEPLPKNDGDLLRVTESAKKIVAKAVVGSQMRDPKMDRSVATLLLNELSEAEALLKNVRLATDYAYRQHDWHRTRLTWMNGITAARRQEVQDCLDAQKMFLEIGQALARLASGLDALEGIAENSADLGEIAREGTNLQLVRLSAELLNDIQEYTNSCFELFTKLVEQRIQELPKYQKLLLDIKTQLSHVYRAYQRIINEKAPASRLKALRNVGQIVISLLEIWAQHEQNRLKDELTDLDRNSVAEAEVILAQNREFSRLEQRLSSLQECLKQVVEAKQKLASLYQQVFREPHRYTPRNDLALFVPERTNDGGANGQSAPTWGPLLRYYNPYVFQRGILLRDFEPKLTIAEGAPILRVPEGGTIQATIGEAKSEKLTVRAKPNR